MLTTAVLSSYAAIDAAFWADVDSRVGAAATPRFRQYCARFREAWATEAAPDPAAVKLTAMSLVLRPLQHGERARVGGGTLGRSL